MTTGALGRSSTLNPQVRVPGIAVFAFVAIATGSVGALAAYLASFGPREKPSPAVAVAILGGGLLLALLVAAALRIADQWERAVVLRLGKFHGLRGPGLFTVVPVIDRVAYYVDQRIRATDFAAESCLTKDTVPVNVDAIAFWVVWDAEKAALEVQSYTDAVVLSAQTALRDAIGKHDLAELIQARKELGSALREILDQKMHDWGITVQSVEIRDVVIPRDLEDAMSRQAQAERERQARIILGTAETEIAAKFVDAAQSYGQSPIALNLRAMNMLYEGIVKRGALMVVPSSLAGSLDAGAVAGLATLGGARIPNGSKPDRAEEPVL